MGTFTGFGKVVCLYTSPPSLIFGTIIFSELPNTVIADSDETILIEGNHYFMVRAAKDLNQDSILQLDEVDPTAAMRVWSIGPAGIYQPPTTPEKPIKYWEEE